MAGAMTRDRQRCQFRFGVDEKPLFCRVTRPERGRERSRTGEWTRAKAQSTPSSEETVNYLGTIIDPLFSDLCELGAFARDIPSSVATLPLEVLRGGYTPDKVPTA
jgi:hypothetical protein